MNSSTMPKLLIPSPIYEAMIRQALAEAPLECCGLLSGPAAEQGGDLRAMACYPLINAAASPVEYESDPKSMFAAFRDMRMHGLDILAVYHSHPTSPPVPSRKDRERNYSERVMSLIISLQNAQPEVRGWWLTTSDQRQAEWKVIDG